MAYLRSTCAPHRRRSRLERGEAQGDRPRRSRGERRRPRAADWRLGIAAAAEWIEEHAEDETLVFIDAPLVVTNPAGTQRTCEWHVGKCYGRAQVSANSTHIEKERLGGVTLRKELERRGFRYDDGLDGPPKEGRVVSECYPYTTIVGTAELDYNVRPRYKRRPKNMSVREFRPIRARECDELIRRVARLAAAAPPLDLRSHEHTRLLLDVPSPVKDATAYKHREDLLDAALAAWKAALWWNKGLDGCQVLGDEPDVERPAATIIAPAKPEQLIAQRLTAAAVRERRTPCCPCCCSRLATQSQPSAPSDRSLTTCGRARGSSEGIWEMASARAVAAASRGLLRRCPLSNQARRRGNTEGTLREH